MVDTLSNGIVALICLPTPLRRAGRLSTKQPNMKNATLKKSGTDLKRLDAMTDADIDLSDILEVTPEMFATGVIRRSLQPITKRQLSLRLD